jgi:phosphoserine phosphatase
MARPTKGVSTLALKIIKKAVKIRLDRGEDLNEIVESYTKLSQSQADEILAEFADYNN